jgi:hypothetical protein
MWKLGLEKKAAQFFFYKYLFRIFGIVSLQCACHCQFQLLVYRTPTTVITQINFQAWHAGFQCRLSETI